MLFGVAELPANPLHLLAFDFLKEFAGLFGFFKFEGQKLRNMHIFELKSIVEHAVLAHEGTNLTQYPLCQLFSFLRELMIVFIVFEAGDGFLDVLEAFVVKQELRSHLKYLLRVVECVVEPFRPIHHQQGPIFVRLLIFLENLVVVNVGHLPC